METPNAGNASATGALRPFQPAGPSAISDHVADTPKEVGHEEVPDPRRSAHGGPGAFGPAGARGGERRDGPAGPSERGVPHDIRFDHEHGVPRPDRDGHERVRPERGQRDAL